MATAQAAPVGMPMATAQATPVTEQQARMELPGKRKSLLVGINYYGTQAELSGCVADVKRMRPLLEQHGFPSSEDCQMVLLDEPGWPKPPTKANLQRAIQWLTQDVQTGDALFFHYSGHGGREESYTAASGYVETICPEDYEVEGMLLDTELFDTLVRPLPAGCRLTCLMDCCHSGGVLNLPYLFTGTQENLKQALAGKAVSMAMSKDWIRDLRAMQSGDPVAFLQDAASMGLGLWGLWKQRKAAENADSSGFATDEERRTWASPWGRWLRSPAAAPRSNQCGCGGRPGAVPRAERAWLLADGWSHRQGRGRPHRGVPGIPQGCRVLHLPHPAGEDPGASGGGGF
ncbi:unnamed protein product [Effrenium voratum]|nr:unnamed protein product [Effrenium voratum]